ncbi:MAG: 1-acyl-sn-glycerol-3-phosphate acyltransferase, partial [Bacteroidota bacterium]
MKRPRNVIFEKNDISYHHSSMLYQLTKPFAKLTLAVYFRKIYLSNLDVIPKDKPVIFAANHPTAFIEPCLLACWLDRRLHFLARGDLYLKPWLRRLYDTYGLIPIFRLDDAGYGKLKFNFGSFDRVYNAFKEKKAVMILAEGRTKHEKRLRPIMKGTARLVFGAMEKYGDLDIHIVPTAVNYTNPDQFRSVAMIDFGAPIRASEYLEIYREHPFKAVTQLTREISKRLGERVIHVQNE